VEDKLPAGPVIDRDPNDVRRQQVGGELDTPEWQSERDCDRVRQRGFADTGCVLDQQVPAGQQASQALPDLQALADDDAADLGGGRAEFL